MCVGMFLCERLWVKVKALDVDCLSVCDGSLTTQQAAAVHGEAPPLGGNDYSSNEKGAEGAAGPALTTPPIAAANSGLADLRLTTTGILDSVSSLRGHSATIAHSSAAECDTSGGKICPDDGIRL